MAPSQTLHEQGINVTYTAIALLCQTFFFGQYYTPAQIHI